MRRLIAVVVAVLMVVGCASLARGDEPFVDPYEASSTSGEWVLRVEPSSPGGEGPAAYRMTRGGEVAWEATLEYTLQECVIGANGVVVGYAYDLGLSSVHSYQLESSLIIATIGTDGKVLVSEKHKRLPSYFPSDNSPWRPRCEGLLLDDVTQRAIVCITHSFSGHGKYSWRNYSTVTGELLDVQEITLETPVEDSSPLLVEAQVVPGTPLVAVHWYQYEQAGAAASFTILDAEGKLVWSRHVPLEYSKRPEGWYWWDLIRDGVRQIEVGPSSFAIVSYLDGLRRTYAVSKGGGGQWQIVEGNSEKAEPAVRARASESAASLVTTPGELQPRRTVELGTPAATGVIDGILQMRIDGLGRMGWMRWVRGGDPVQRFTLVDRDGRTVADYPLEIADDKDAALLVATWLDGDRWVIAQQFASRDVELRAWFLDAATGETTPIGVIAGSSIESICRMPRNGKVGFATLTGFSTEHTRSNHVIFYDHEGKRIAGPEEWRFDDDLYIKDLEVLTDGTLALLVGIANEPTVRLYRPGHELAETADLKQAVVGARMPYFASIRADSDGGFLVYDSANDNLLHRFDAKGSLRSSTFVSDEQGSRFRINDNYGVDPDGRLWASDKHRLFRLGEGGRAELTFGGPAEGTMATPCAVTMDARGWIYALETGTSFVHVFDEAGKPIRVMRPKPWQTSTQDSLPWIRVDDKGRVRASMGMFSGVMVFDADGTPGEAERESRTWMRDPDVWRVVPGGGWEENGRAVRRRLANGGVGDPIRYRPDGAWLVEVEHAAAASDGSLILICTREEPNASLLRFFEPTDAWLCAYGPDGEPRSVLRFTMPRYSVRLAYDGARAYISDNSGVTVVPVPMDGQGMRFDYGDEREYWGTMLLPDGMLATWRHGAREVRFWKLPG